MIKKNNDVTGLGKTGQGGVGFKGENLRWQGKNVANHPAFQVKKLHLKKNNEKYIDYIKILA